MENSRTNLTEERKDVLFKYSVKKWLGKWTRLEKISAFLLLTLAACSIMTICILTSKSVKCQVSKASNCSSPVIAMKHNDAEIIHEDNPKKFITMEELNEQNKKIAALELVNEELQKKLATVEKTREAETKTISTLQRLMEETLSKLLVIDKHNEAANTKFSDLEGANESTRNNDVLKIQKINETTNAKITSLRLTLEEVQNILAEVGNNNKELNRKIATLEQGHEEGQFKTETAVRLNEAVNRTIVTVQREVEEEHQKIVAIDAFNEEIRNNITILTLKNEEGQRIFVEMKKTNDAANKTCTDLQKRFEEAKTKLETIQEENEASNRKISGLEQTNVATVHLINNIKLNSVPVGFIYVQLPGKVSPTALWPQTKWKDVSTDYAGLFFRVDGENAAPFGTLQEDNTRRLAQVFYAHSQDHTDPIIPADGSWSRYAYTGKDELIGTVLGMRFRLTTGEVRPRNKSVKLWQRVG